MRVQNEGTGKSSWWMLNPDAKPGGKSSRRRTASVEGSNGPNGSGGRGPDFKRRGRNKKNSTATSAGNMLRNGHGHGHGGGADTTPSPVGGHAPGGQPLIELYPESPSLHQQHYPFPPGRMSPSLLGHGPEGGPHPAFYHPAAGGPGGQGEWGAEYQCGTMPPYFAGTYSR